MPFRTCRTANCDSCRAPAGDAAAVAAPAIIRLAGMATAANVFAARFTVRIMGRLSPDLRECQAPACPGELTPNPASMDELVNGKSKSAQTAACQALCDAVTARHRHGPARHPRGPGPAPRGPGQSTRR